MKIGLQLSKYLSLFKHFFYKMDQRRANVFTQKQGFFYKLINAMMLLVFMLVGFFVFIGVSILAMVFIFISSLLVIFTKNKQGAAVNDTIIIDTTTENTNKKVN